MTTLEISLVIGVATLIVERLFTLSMKIKSSDCWGSHFEFNK